MHRTVAIVFAVLVLLAVVQVFLQLSRLPATVASHFTALGQPDHWTSRGALASWQVGAVFFMAGMLEGIARLIRHISIQLVNLPHRDYWFDPARRSASEAWLMTTLRIIGCAITIFLMVVFHLVYRANLSGDFATTALLPLVGTLLFFLAVILAALLLRFGRRPSAA